MGVMVETWVVKDPKLEKEHDEFMVKWIQYVVSYLGKTSPNHRYYAQTEPAGGRTLMAYFKTKAKMDEVLGKLGAEKEFQKFQQEFMEKYVDNPPVVTYWNNLKKKEIDSILAKAWE
jgi:hypothetical protein